MPKIKLLIIFLVTINFCSFSQRDTILTRIPANILLQETNQSKFSISPNGKLFVEILEENQQYYIVVIDIDAYKAINTIPLGSSSLGNINWLTNKRLIYEKFGEIYAIDIDGTNKIKIVNGFDDKKVKNLYRYHLNNRFNSILSLSLTEQDEILIESFDLSFNAYVKKVNVYTGESNILYDGKALKINKWLCDKNGNVNLGIRVTDSDYEYFKKPDNSKELIPIELNIGNQLRPFKINGKSFFKENTTLIDTDFNNNILYLATNVNSDKRKLVKYDISRRAVLDTLVSDLNCDVSDDDQQLSLLFDYKSRTIGSVYYDGVVPETRTFTSTFDDVNNALRIKFPKHVNQIIDFDSNQNRFVIYQWSDVYAGNIGVFDYTTGQYYVIFQVNKTLNNYKLAKTKSYSITNEEGFKLPIYLTLPLNYQTSRNVPLVIIPHGGPWTRDYWRFDSFTQFFASRGYAVLRVNYRGSTGFGKKHLNAGIEGIGSTMINDVAHSTRTIIKDYKIDKEKVFIYGHSYGGYVTYMALANYPDLYTAGVAIAAPTDIKKLMKLQKKEGKKFSYDYWSYALGNNTSDFYKLVSPINYVEKINSPLLVFHGKYDRIVPLEQFEDMELRFKKLKKTNGTFRTIQFLGHSLEDSNSHGYVLKEAEEFFMDSLN